MHDSARQPVPRPATRSGRRGGVPRALRRDVELGGQEWGGHRAMILPCFRRASRWIDRGDSPSPPGPVLNGLGQVRGFDALTARALIWSCCIAVLTSARPSSLNRQISRTSVGPMSALQLRDVSAKRSRRTSRARSTRARIASESSPRRSAVSLSSDSQSRRPPAAPRCGYQFCQGMYYSNWVNNGMFFRRFGTVTRCFKMVTNCYALVTGVCYNDFMQVCTIAQERRI
jgi:hypothetical protein